MKKTHKSVNFRNLLCTAILVPVLCALPACSGEKENEAPLPPLVRLDLLLDPDQALTTREPEPDGIVRPAEAASPGMLALLRREKETMQETTVGVVSVKVPSVRSCRVRIPERGRLSGKIGLKAPGMAKEDRPDLLFRIDLRPERGDKKEIFAFHEDRITGDLEGTWQDFFIDLADRAGQTVELIFSVRSSMPLSPGQQIIAFWGNPVLYAPVEKHERPNIVVVSLDTLRADHLGCYGYHRETSPFIDSLAEKGVRLSRLTANTPLTTPSHMSIMTSLYPQNHGVLAGRYRLTRRVPTLAAVLAAGGYLTAAFTEGGNISSVHGFFLGCFNSSY